MLGCKSAARSSISKKDGEFRYATRLLAHERSKRTNQNKECVPLKACERLLKSDGWKNSKYALMPKSNVKKCNAIKTSNLKDVKNKQPFSKHQEKVVIVSKRSSSVSVVKSSNMKRSVSVKKVSYSTSVILSSDEEEEEEEESDSDDDDEGQEKQKVYTRTRSTILKRTTSKTKTKTNTLKKDDKVSKKSKFVKSSKEKNVLNKKKTNMAPRELRPRFPYSATQEWPTARAHRMASLNALAKVHILYENEGRAPGENTNEGDDNCILELSDDELSFNESKSSADVKASFKEKSSNESKNTCSDKSKKNDCKIKTVKRAYKRKPASDVEIIDTKLCKRMASLNAQAILAASYLEEKPKREKIVKRTEKPSDVEIKEIILESSCNLKIIEEEKQVSSVQNECTSEEIQCSSDNSQKEQTSKKHTSEVNENNVTSRTILSQHENDSSEKAVNENQVCITLSDDDKSSNERTTTAVSEVGVTKYTAVTKVQINTTKEMEIKEECQAEQKIERIVEKDDVAITRMYHYQSKNASQSYCVQMQTTYKPASKNFTPPPPSLVNQRSGGHVPHVMGAVMPSRQNYYNYPGRSPILASQSYPVNHGISGMQPVVGVDHVGRHYGGSAFSVPHYGHPAPLPYPHPDYGYYQPAGPLIQPVHDPRMIHKPVPYHPQPQPHPTLHKPQPPVSSSLPVTASHDHYSSVDHCFSRSSTTKATLPSSKHDNSFNDILPSESSTSHTSSHPPTSQHAFHGNHQRSDNCDTNHCKRTVQHSTQSHSPSSSTAVYSGRGNSDNYHGNAQNYSVSGPSSSFSSSRYHEHLPQRVASPSSKSRNDIGCRNTMNSVKGTSASEPYSNMPAPQHSFPQSDGALPQDVGNHSFAHNSSLLKDPNDIDSNVKVADVRKQKYDYSPYVRPPSVVEVIDDCDSGDTKTYIELDVPKACPQEKIVVVGKNKNNANEQRYIEKKETLPSVDYRSSIIKPSVRPEIIEVKDDDNCSNNYTKNKDSKDSSNNNFCADDAPDVMVIEVTKKKETSALIRRAKLHGKQRTFRDSENRPLVPYSKARKSLSPVILQHHQKDIFQPLVSLSRLVLPKKTESFSHGWSWDGKPEERLVYISNDDPPVQRKCYPAMCHNEGDKIRIRDCVLLRSGIRKTDVPFIAKVTALWENPNDGEMTMSLLWYYRPEHIEQGRAFNVMDDEIFASKHRDSNSVACIEDKCYVLTFGEYCRYRRRNKMLESCSQSLSTIVPQIDDYPRKERLPSHNVSPEMVFFCRKVYDFRQKRILKNPI